MASLVREMSLRSPTRLAACWLDGAAPAVAAAAPCGAPTCCSIMAGFGRWYAYIVPVLAATSSARALQSRHVSRTRLDAEVDSCTRCCSNTGRERAVGGRSSDSDVDASDSSGSVAAGAAAGVTVAAAAAAAAAACLLLGLVGVGAAAAMTDVLGDAALICTRLGGSRSTSAEAEKEQWQSGLGVEILQPSKFEWVGI